MGNTKKDLLNDLQPYLKKFSGSRKERLFELMERAKDGYYHDFDSPLSMPKYQLNQDLLMLGLTVQAKKVREGEYDDEEPTEEQKKELMDLLTKEVKKNE